MICFHHNDADGRCAGHLVGKNCSKPGEFDLYVEMDYKRPFPIDMIKKDDEVYIVDYSIEPAEMDQLLEKTKHVVWIDHHKTAIEKYKDYPVEIPGIRLDGVAACMLTWLYFEKQKEDREFVTELDAPYYIRLIADYDVWTFYLGEKVVKPFIKGLRLYNTQPGSGFWDIVEQLYSTISYQGQLLLDYDERNDYGMCKHNGFVVQIDGLKGFCVNKGINSDTFKSVAGNEEYDFYAGCTFDGKGWNYMLRSGFDERSKKVDVGALAAKHGGGGHKHASGFRADNFVFEVVEE